MAQPSLYETDIVAWADQQVEALRRLAETAPSNAVDWPNLIEEIESVGRSQLNGVERKLILILAHLLKVISAPDSPASRGWRSEIASHQRVVRRQFSNSMRQLIKLEGIWMDARQEAGDALTEWGDRVARGLPEKPPVTLDDLIGIDFDVDRALSTIAGAIGETADQSRRDDA